MTDAVAPSRRRVVEWQDPHIGAAEARTLGGLEYLNAMIAGRIPPPPIAVLMNLELVSASRGTAVFTCSPDESVYNPIGAVHGGFMRTALDSDVGRTVATASSTLLVFDV
ncbi:PaaI family thioesterase [Agreia sp.]|uniref:PaaI family thioesterase n=1 Tax=Agreia sp. TaxID=1872416 RepID=UPI0035BC94E0